MIPNYLSLEHIEQVEAMVDRTRKAIEAGKYETYDEPAAIGEMVIETVGLLALKKLECASQEYAMAATDAYTRLTKIAFGCAVNIAMKRVRDNVAEAVRQDIEPWQGPQGDE